MCGGGFTSLYAYKGQEKASSALYHSPTIPLRQGLSMYLTSCFSDRLEASNCSCPLIPTCLGADTDTCGHTASVLVLGPELILMSMQQVL